MKILEVRPSTTNTIMTKYYRLLQIVNQRFSIELHEHYKNMSNKIYLLVLYYHKRRMFLLEKQRNNGH